MSEEEYTCLTPCGLCCVITTHVHLSKAEVESGLYETIEIKDDEEKSDNPEMSDQILRQVRRHVPEVRKRLFVCIYLDMKTRRCKIYENRPLGCRVFNCKEEESYSGDREWLYENKAKFADLYVKS